MSAVEGSGRGCGVEGVKGARRKLFFIVKEKGAKIKVIAVSGISHRSRRARELFLGADE
jgi:hypothetical protein